MASVGKTSGSTGANMTDGSAEAGTEVRRAIASMAVEVGPELTANVLGLDPIVVRRLAKNTSSRHQTPRIDNSGGSTRAMRNAYPPRVLPAELAIVAWADPVIEALGHGPDRPTSRITRSKWIFEVSECLVLEGGRG